MGSEGNLKILEGGNHWRNLFLKHQDTVQRMLQRHRFTCGQFTSECKYILDCEGHFNGARWSRRVGRPIHPSHQVVETGIHRHGECTWYRHLNLTLKNKPRWIMNVTHQDLTAGPQFLFSTCGFGQLRKLKVSNESLNHSRSPSWSSGNKHGVTQLRSWTADSAVFLIRSVFVGIVPQRESEISRCMRHFWSFWTCLQLTESSCVWWQRCKLSQTDCVSHMPKCVYLCTDPSIHCLVFNTVI